MRRQYTALMYSFPDLKAVCFPCLVLTVASWSLSRFLRRHVRCFGIPISWRISHSLWWSTNCHSQRFWCSQWSRSRCFSGILSNTLLACKMSTICSSLNILWHCLSLGLEWKLTFSSPVVTAEFLEFAGILGAALQQHHLLGFELAQLVFHTSTSFVHSDAS